MSSRSAWSISGGWGAGFFSVISLALVRWVSLVGGRGKGSRGFFGFEQGALAFEPCFELEDGLLLLGKLNLRIAVVDVARPLRGVTEDFPADFLHNAREHHSRVRRVTKIMKSDVTDSSSPKAGGPG